MATSTTVLPVFAHAMRISRESAICIARPLMAAGFIEKGRPGGGKGAAHFSKEHLTSLALGALTPLPSRSAEACAKLRDLPLQVVTDQGWARFFSAFSRKLTAAEVVKAFLDPAAYRSLRRVSLAGSPETENPAVWIVFETAREPGKPITLLFSEDKEGLGAEDEGAVDVRRFGSRVFATLAQLAEESPPDDSDLTLKVGAALAEDDPWTKAGYPLPTGQPDHSASAGDDRPSPWASVGFVPPAPEAQPLSVDAAAKAGDEKTSPKTPRKGDARRGASA
jgi:hypothetical protein